MKLGANRPPGDNPLLFSISGTGSCILWFGLFSRWFYFRAIRAKGKRAKLRIQRKFISSTRLDSYNRVKLQAVIDTRSVNFNILTRYIHIVWGGSGVGTANINFY